MKDTLWINNVNVLHENFTDFFPNEKQTKIEKLNSISRLVLYISILTSIYHKDIRYMLLFIITGLYVYKISKDLNLVDDRIEHLKEPMKCQSPTLGNPFMNPTMSDYMNVDKDGRIRDRLEACDPNDPEIKKDIDSKFNNNLYRDVSDVFGKNNSQRQFYTTPSTTIPNDPQNNFGKWLYQSGQTCKENQDNCLRFEDVRAKRYIFPDPENNPVVS